MRGERVTKQDVSVTVLVPVIAELQSLCAVSNGISERLEEKISIIHGGSPVVDEAEKVPQNCLPLQEEALRLCDRIKMFLNTIDDNVERL